MSTRGQWLTYVPENTAYHGQDACFRNERGVHCCMGEVISNLEWLGIDRAREVARFRVTIAPDDHGHWELDSGLGTQQWAWPGGLDSAEDGGFPILQAGFYDAILAPGNYSAMVEVQYFGKEENHEHAGERAQ